MLSFLRVAPTSAGATEALPDEGEPLALFFFFKKKNEPLRRDVPWKVDAVAHL